MKKVLLMALAVGLLTACSNDEIGRNESKSVKFSLNGDFTFYVEPMTRSLEADGSAMTDVWVLDYVGGVLVQQLHQSSTDDDFGSPVLTLSPGAHHLYFVTSRGTTPTVDTDAATLTWVRPSDTFWKDYDLILSSSTPDNVTVTCDRVVSKLLVTVTDAIPEGAATFNITPHTWYYGLNYTTGAPVAAQTDATSTINIPSSVIGQSGINVTLFSFSSATSWRTDIAVNSKKSNGDVLGSVSIANVPFERNRKTVMSGVLYADVVTHTITLNTTWSDPYNMTF